MSLVVLRKKCFIETCTHNIMYQITIIFNSNYCHFIGRTILHQKCYLKLSNTKTKAIKKSSSTEFHPLSNNTSPNLFFTNSDLNRHVHTMHKSRHIHALNKFDLKFKNTHMHTAHTRNEIEKSSSTSCTCCTPICLI